MRGTVVAAVFGAVMLGGPSADAVIVHVDPVQSPPCAKINWRRGVEQRIRLIRCVARPKAFGPVPGGWERAVAIAMCESYPQLRPRTMTGSSVGVFQLNSRYARGWWERWAKPFGLRYRLKDAYVNAVIAISKAREEGWSAWGCA